MMIILMKMNLKLLFMLGLWLKKQRKACKNKDKELMPIV